MRDAERNKTKIYYALRNVRLDKDEWGNTKNVTTYSPPVELRISVSANKGEASSQAFGADLQYDREMVTHNMSCPINEYSKLWINESIFDNNSQAVYGEDDVIVIEAIDAEVEAVGDTVKITSDLLSASISGIAVLKEHNYEVAAVSKSLNCIRYAIRRVNLSR